MKDVEKYAEEIALACTKGAKDMEDAKNLFLSSVIGVIEDVRYGHPQGYIGLTFGQAINHLKMGHKVARAGWNGKNMFLWLKPAATVKSEWCKDPELKTLAEANGGEIEALGTICMKTADNKILSGWLASQTDMLANDWMVLFSDYGNTESKESK